MQLFTDEYRGATMALHLPLKPYMQSSDMGANAYVLGDRRVTTKVRMRKDKEAVVSLGCWQTYDDWDSSHPTSDRLWWVTTALPPEEKATQIGTFLAAYLEKGIIPTEKLPTYPGYEDFDSEPWPYGRKTNPAS